MKAVVCQDQSSITHFKESNSKTLGQLQHQLEVYLVRSGHLSSLRIGQRLPCFRKCLSVGVRECEVREPSFGGGKLKRKVKERGKDCSPDWGRRQKLRTQFAFIGNRYSGKYISEFSLWKNFSKIVYFIDDKVRIFPMCLANIQSSKGGNGVGEGGLYMCWRGRHCLC